MGYLNKIKVKHLFILLAIFIIILTIIILMLVKQGNQCVSNPFIYGAKEYQSNESGELFCSCTYENPKYKGFFFNKDNVTINPGLLG